MRNIYDNSEFFAAYAEMGRSKDGLKAAGEWHQLQPLFPKLQGKKVLDLGCGYGWHCKYAAQMGATEILGIDSSQKMIAKAVADNSDDKIKYKVCGVEEYIYPENTYDLVVSNLVLHYIENLANVYQKVYCTLKVGGISYSILNIRLSPQVLMRIGFMMKMGNLNIGQSTITITQAKEKPIFLVNE